MFFFGFFFPICKLQELTVPIWASNSTLRHTPKRMKMSTQNIFVAALRIKVKRWNEPKGPYWWMDKHKMAYPCNGILHSREKESADMLQHAWVSETCSVKETLHKRSHTIWVHSCKITRIEKSTETDKRFVVKGLRRRRHRGGTSNGYRVSVWGVEKALEWEWWWLRTCVWMF